MSATAGTRRLVIRAPPQLAAKIAGRLHLYYDTKVEPVNDEYCEIYTVIEGRKIVICQFEHDLGLSNIMTLFRVKTKQLGL